MKTYKVAIVGAGPAGYFTAQALNNSADAERGFQIDMFDRLPTPWGLVRSGVAPDHPKIRTVTKVFEKIAAEPNYRYFGNVELGRDIQIADLERAYDVVVLATGTSLGKKLGIPGEELPGVISAADFVPWYNGHPDYEGVNPPLTGKYAIVIGAGNVAMDCGRMLALAPHELSSTDIADHALDFFIVVLSGMSRLWVAVDQSMLLLLHQSCANFLSFTRLMSLFNINRLMMQSHALVRGLRARKISVPI